MKHVVGVAEMKIASDPQDTVVTYALGSCLGIAVYDPGTRVGGILHAMMPGSRSSPDKARANPCMFVDTGVPALLRAFFNAGGRRPNMILKVAGGAHMNLKSGRDRFQIGRRNYIVLKKLLWKNSILIDAENVGGTVARTLSLDLGPGSFWLSIGGVKQAF